MSRMMEITTKIGCKVDCRYCPQRLLYDRYFAEDKERETTLSLEKFKEYANKVPKDVQIVFSGFCEPWQNEACTDMVEYAVRGGWEVDTYSTLRDMKPEDYYRLRELPIHNFVLHAADKDGNSKIPVTRGYLSLLSEIAEDHASGRFKLASISVHGQMHPEVEKILGKLTDVNVLSEIYNRAGNLEADEGISIAVDREKKGHISCSKCNGDELSKNILLPDGTVVMCMMDYGLEYILGNLNTDSYIDIAEGPKKMEIRRLLRSEKNGKLLCRYCHVAKAALSYNTGVFTEKTREMIRELLK
ncbi:MAG: SPASM domain-containing protein [Lachnospiraceae bacterium]|nr:SPASM domain-containing protein [Lachnospiraceae bacterium]